MVALMMVIKMDVIVGIIDKICFKKLITLVMSFLYVKIKKNLDFKQISA